MDVLEYIQHEVANMRRSVTMTLQGMTPELLNAATPGTANTISATLVHFVNTEDNFIQKIIQGKPSLWESQAWGQKTGISKLPRIGEDWSGFKHTQVALQPLLDYQAAVWAGTDVYLASLTPDDLDRMVQFAGSERCVADVLLLGISQALCHAGEIAALKGVLGAVGFPI